MARRKNSILNEEVENREVTTEVAEEIVEEAVTAVETTEGEKPVEKETEAPKAATPKRRRLERTPTIKSISGQLEAKTQSKMEKEAWIEVNASKNFRRILTGRVSGVEFYNNKPCIYIRYKGLKVLIPAKKFLEELPADDEMDTESPNYMGKTRSYLAHRMGSEVDFVCVGYDRNDRLVAASRLAAMKIRQKQIYLRKNPAGEYLLNEGDLIEARVVSALNKGILVEVGGLDLFVPRQEVSWLRKTDVSGDYAAGDKVVVKVTELDRTDPENIKAAVSIKQATEPPFSKAIRTLNTDKHSTYFGEITHINARAIYVRLDDEDIEVTCKLLNNGSVPTVGTKVAVHIIEIVEERRLIRGEITWQGKSA